MQLAPSSALSLTLVSMNGFSLPMNNGLHGGDTMKWRYALGITELRWWRNGTSWYSRVKGVLAFEPIFPACLPKAKRRGGGLYDYRVIRRSAANFGCIIRSRLASGEEGSTGTLVKQGASNFRPRPVSRSNPGNGKKELDEVKSNGR